tara:strand:+ start:9443 stop:10495 length:1053 start_codon:yes stop_codon:yes gene_type:complete
MKFLLDSDIDEIVERIDSKNELQGKTILMTGARGFLGRYFVHVIKKVNSNFERPVKFIGIDNQITSGVLGSDISEDSNITLIEHDIINNLKIKEDIDYVIHAAGIASPHYYREFPLETLDVAINGTRHMLELSKEKNAKFTFFSSSEVYGDPDKENIPTSEKYRGNVSTLGPRSCYDEGKRVGETLCHIYQTNFGVNTNIIRPFNFYGPGMQEKDFRVLPNFGSRIKAGLPLKVYGHGNQTRTFCYITDAIVGLFKVIIDGKSGESYNIGNPDPEISMIELVKKIKRILENDIQYEIIDYPDSYPSDEPNRRCPNIQKAIQEINYIPRVNIDEGLRRFFQWTNENYEGLQ